ncbi:MAG: hypothetical protein J0L52_11975 [Caulobacterales bacterium]|nr:hypothetical protein [Caulobacterales bacterium]
MKALALIAAAALALAGCTTLAPYGPQAAQDGQGYSEYRIENQRWRVTYNGVGAPGPVADMALLRAADLTVEQGYDWFEVTQRFVDGRPDSAGGVRPSVSVGYGGGSYHGPYGRYSTSGAGVGVGVNIQGPSRTSTTLEILLGRGEPPPRGPVFAAREVQQNLRGRF